MTEIKKLHRAGDVRFRAVGGETVVLRQNDALVLVLNEVGGRVLELADGRTESEIVDELIDEFEVERAELEADVSAFVTELIGEGVVVAQESLS